MLRYINIWIWTFSWKNWLQTKEWKIICSNSFQNYFQCNCRVFVLIADRSSFEELFSLDFVLVLILLLFSPYCSGIRVYANAVACVTTILSGCQPDKLIYIFAAIYTATCYLSKKQFARVSNWLLRIICNAMTRFIQFLSAYRIEYSWRG